MQSKYKKNIVSNLRHEDIILNRSIKLVLHYITTGLQLHCEKMENTQTNSYKTIFPISKLTHKTNETLKLDEKYTQLLTICEYKNKAG